MRLTELFHKATKATIPDLTPEKSASRASDTNKNGPETQTPAQHSPPLPAVDSLAKETAIDRKPSEERRSTVESERSDTADTTVADERSLEQPKSREDSTDASNSTPAEVSERAADRIEPEETQQKETNGPPRDEQQRDSSKEEPPTASKELAHTVTNGTTDSEDEAGVDDESKYPKALPLTLLTFGLCVSIFVVALDNTIIATAIPKITTVFNSLNDVGWYGSAYLLTTTSLQPSFGKIYTYFNVKWTYILALVIFEIGSVVCAAARNSTMLIVGRAVAGVGASALFSGGMTIIGYAVPLRKRAIYIALLSSMFGISSVVGPILGGVFTDRLTWRWCFWINLPFGGVAITSVFFFFKNPDRKHSNMTTREKLGQVDLLGALFLICAIVCLLLALQWGGSVYPWSNSKVWGDLLGFGLIILVFIYIQVRGGDRATIPPRIILHNRTVIGCSIFSVFLAMGIYTQIYYLPFYFQAVKSTTAEGSGIRTIPFLVSNTIASLVVGGSITAIGPYVPFLYIGSAIYIAGSVLLFRLKVSSNAGQWIGYQVLAGAGSGACIQIPFIAVQVVLAKKDMPTGNAIAVFFNTLGGAISISVAQNIFSNTLLSQIPRYTVGVDPRLIAAAGATHVREVTPPSQLAGVLEAYDVAVTHALILPIAVGCLTFLSSVLFEWKTVKGKNLMGGGAA